MANDGEDMMKEGGRTKRGVFAKARADYLETAMSNDRARRFSSMRGFARCRSTMSRNFEQTRQHADLTTNNAREWDRFPEAKVETDAGSCCVHSIGAR